MTSARARRQDIRSFCRICAAACGIVVTVDGQRVERVRGDPDHPVSRGYTCPKGRALPDWHHGDAWLDTPALRGAPSTWDDALDDLGHVVHVAMRDGGPDAIGAYLATGLAYDINGWLTAERLLRRVGTRQRYTPVTVDNAPVLRAAELVTGTSELNTVWDPDRSRLLLAFGTNPVVSHGYGTTLADPVVRFRDFRAAGGQLWVIDPRHTETAALADAHLAIRPGTDHLVLAWLVRELLVDGADRHELDAHCHEADVDLLTSVLEPFDRARVARVTGLGDDTLARLLDVVRESRRLAAMCGTGITMSADGVVAEWLRWALLIVTGSVDREGGMRCNQGWLFPLDERPWPQTVAGVDAPPPDPGPASRPELARWLGQHPCIALVDEIERGPLRVLIVAGGNPLTAFPQPARIRGALERLDALVVLDVVESELTELATHVLPVAGQLERADVSMLENVSFANGTQHTPAVVAADGARRPSWWVLAQLARRLGVDVLGGLDPDVCDDETLLRGVAARSRGGYDELVAAGPHGVRADDRYGWVHEQVLPGGRWNLAPRTLVDRLAAMIDASPDDGLVLAPRRRVRSMNSARYVAAGDEGREPAEIRMHPDDAAAYELDDAQPNRRGERARRAHRRAPRRPHPSSRCRVVHPRCGGVERGQPHERAHRSRPRDRHAARVGGPGDRTRRDADSALDGRERRPGEVDPPIGPAPDVVRAYDRPGLLAVAAAPRGTFGRATLPLSSWVLLFRGAAMRIGIITPIVILLPRSHNEWEVDASVDDLVAVATAADRLGYHHLTASEHIAVPVDVEARRGKRYWDLLSTLSYVAAVTERIRLATNMVVLPYHHPLEIVKHYSTLDRLSRGRVILGVGVGTLREEFELLGAPLEGRGERADDALRAIRAAWGQREPRYEGSHYTFGDVVVDPTGVQARVPVWVGGRTRRSLRRALELGDAWVPFLLDPADVRAMLDWGATTPAAGRRDRPLDVALWPEPALDTLREPDRVREQAEEHLAAGATILNFRFPSRSLVHHLEQMEALTEILDFAWDE